MQLLRAELTLLIYFLTIAKHKSFKRAALELGVSSSALSHGLRGFEERLGVRLLHRTTRSVNLTTAGEELFASIAMPIELLDGALDRLNHFKDDPTGHIKLNVPQDAAAQLLAPVLPIFTERYPRVKLEIIINNKMVDVIAEGFDAGIRFAGTVPEDMVTQNVSAPIRWIVVGSPGYLEKHGAPQTPQDLRHHQCLNIRLGTGALYNWELEEEGKPISINTNGSLIVDESYFSIKLACNGLGLAYVAEPTVKDFLASGDLRTVLEDYSSMGSGYVFYYSSRRQLPVGLKLLIDTIKEIAPLG